MDNQVFNQSDLVGDAPSVVSGYSVSDPPLKSLKGWHHPRKQFVRSEQWAKTIEDHLILYPIEGRELTYIGLPGDDLLDIRYFAERVCKSRGLSICYLGLNENIDASSVRRTRVDSAMFDLRTQYEVVSDKSDVVSDAFSSIAEANSMISKKLESLGCFDIVNLDFCDGLAKNPPGATQAGNYEGIQHLLGRQLKSRNSWLLFLTTRIGEQHCDTEAKNILEGIITGNIDSCPGFDAAVREFCGSAMTDAGAETQTLLINLCGLLKWLGKMCIKASGWKMETVMVDSYRIQRSAVVEDMYSIALRFVPVDSPANDPVGLGRSKPSGDDECRIALEVMERIGARRNVDSLFETQSGLYEQTDEENRRLLKSAGFDLDAYSQKLVTDWHLPLPAALVPQS